ncbi:MULTISPECIES: DOMON domain-containing protein [Desulfobacula]|uniref:DOMON domain protein n=2 Tax=Desulfobacula TaxID=28222 RepID=K0NLY1_DESTT|nr:MULTISPECIES: DOMON domain-containing protein [Desulfobacula]CCK79687.1 DOMON domain protein [Desulfobacula toluolica Tol2]SDU34643.1 DOMON domain-containing protein [Desulfobacula phenolica]
MTKNYFIISIAATVFFLSLLPLYAMDYQHTLEVKDMQFSWTIEGEQIHVQMSAKTTGWVAVGFDPEKAMQGANIIIGAVKEGKFKVEDHYGNRKRGHKSDEEMGGKNDVLNPAGSEADGITTISFSLPLDTGDAYDKPIKQEGTTKVMLAYGAGKDSFRNRHPFRTIYEINFSTGENKKIK